MKALAPHLGDVEALVFDLDGTLVDTFTDLAASVNQLRGEFGRGPMTPEAVKGHVGMGVRHLVESCIEPSDTDELDEVVERFVKHYSAHLLDSTRPYPGVVEGLTRLGKRPMAVLSNKPQAQTRDIVHRLGLEGFFANVFGGDSFSGLKPDPVALTGTLASLSVHPERALMVGDSQVDLQSARAAGVRIGLVTTGLMTRDAALVGGPDGVIDDLRELTP